VVEFVGCGILYVISRSRWFDSILWTSMSHWG